MPWRAFAFNQHLSSSVSLVVPAVARGGRAASQSSQSNQECLISWCFVSVELPCDLPLLYLCCQWATWSSSFESSFIYWYWKHILGNMKYCCLCSLLVPGRKQGDRGYRGSPLLAWESSGKVCKYQWVCAFAHCWSEGLWRVGVWSQGSLRGKLLAQSIHIDGIYVVLVFGTVYLQGK